MKVFTAQWSTLAPSVYNNRGTLLDKPIVRLPGCQDGNTVVKMTLPGLVKTLRITGETLYVNPRYMGNKAEALEQLMLYVKSDINRIT